MLHVGTSFMTEVEHTFPCLSAVLIPSPVNCSLMALCFLKEPRGGLCSSGWSPVPAHPLLPGGQGCEQGLEARGPDSWSPSAHGGSMSIRESVCVCGGVGQLVPGLGLS